MNNVPAAIFVVVVLVGVTAGLEFIAQYFRSPLAMSAEEMRDWVLVGTVVWAGLQAGE